MKITQAYWWKKVGWVLRLFREGTHREYIIYSSIASASLEKSGALGNQEIRDRDFRDLGRRGLRI